MRKKKFYSEIAYILGILLMALGTALIVTADFGVSMIVAPAYLLHLKLVPILPFFTFGMAEYTFQALLLLLMILILRKFRISFLFSFVTAVLYGFALDGFSLLTALLPCGIFCLRVLYFILGLTICTAGVAFFFNTYISPEVYELFVMEVSSKFDIETHKFKMFYDFASLLLSVIMSFLFFGLWHFEGIKYGTLVCAALNGWLIGRFSSLFKKKFEFTDALNLRPFFEGKEKV